MTNILFKLEKEMDFYELGNELKSLRKAQNISQQTMSKDLHISRATISNFENGTSIEVGLNKVIQIADYLGYELVLKEKAAFPIFEDVVNGR